MLQHSDRSAQPAAELRDEPTAWDGENERSQKDALCCRQQPVRPDRQLRRQHQIEQQRDEDCELSRPERIVASKLLGRVDSAPRELLLVELVVTDPGPKLASGHSLTVRGAQAGKGGDERGVRRLPL